MNAKAITSLLLLGLCGLAEAAVRRKDREALFWL